jgi:hypothetical protein
VVVVGAAVVVVVVGAAVVVVVVGAVVEVVDAVVVVVGAVVEVVDAVVVVVGAVVEMVAPGAVVEVVAPGVVVEVVAPVVVVVVVPQELVMVLVSMVTAPFRASSRPSTTAPVVAEIEVRARMVPTKVEFVPRVAELPTCQNTLQGETPTSTTLLALAVVSVLAIWKIKTSSASPWSVSVPVIPNVPDAELYTPDVSVCPPSSVAMVVGGPWPAALV